MSILKLLLSINYNSDTHLQKYKMNLQLFAQDNKTEQATPKRKQEARKKGQVLHSPEVSSAIILMVGFLSFKLFGEFICNNIMAFTQNIFTFYVRNNEMFSGSTLYVFFIEMMILFAKVVLPILLTIMVAGLAINYAQVGFIFTTQPLAFNIDKIVNPMIGLKRMFSIKSVANLLKSILKIVIVSIVAYQYIKGQVGNIVQIMDMELLNIIGYFGALVFNVGIRISLTFVVLALFDYLFQWWQYEKDLKMSKQEVRDEYKETEGNPQIKSKLKEKQRAISMRRMMQEIPKADVVITNPTHYAIALRYDLNVSAAPIVIAKGRDFLAQRIKEIAKENSVEIVENKPLARVLYETVDIGESIPPELYQAVAEVLAFVFSLKNNRMQPSFR